MNIIPSFIFSGLLPCAANKDIRQYLNGILIESNNGAANAVASDGRVMCVVHTNLLWDLGHAIIPRDVCAHLEKMKGNIQFDYIESARRYRATCGSQTIEFAAIDGSYPDWRMIVPKKLDKPSAAAFNVEILEQVVKSAKAFVKACGSRRDSSLAVHTVRERASMFALEGLEGVDVKRVDYVAMPMRGLPGGDAINPQAATA